MPDKVKPLPKKGDVSDMGASAKAENIFNPTDEPPFVKKDLYSDLERIERRGKKRGFSIFSRDK